MKNPHIILQDGKLWAFEPPEKPNPEDYGYNHNIDNWTAWYCDKSSTSKSKYYINAYQKYDRAYSLALKDKFLIEDQAKATEMVKWQIYVANEGFRRKEGFNDQINTIVIPENEPIKWEGGFTIINACQSDVCTEDGRCEHCRDPKKLVRLIAPVKEENRDAQGFFLCPVDNKICWQSNCLHFDDKPTYCGNREEKMKPVPSEQEKQEETLPFEFVEWYSGMSKDKIQRAYEKWLREYRTPAPHMY